MSIERLVPSPFPSPPKLPFADDIASQEFPNPLPVADAERILLQTEVFNRNPWRQIQAYNVILDQPDALARVRTIARHARRAGQLYALCALWSLDTAGARALAGALSAITAQIKEHRSDVVTDRSVRELVEMIEEEHLWVEFRGLRAAAYRQYAKTG